MYRGDTLLGVVSSDSPNASATARINLPDGGSNYGNALYWKQLIPTSDVLLGDRWIVYGWDTPPDVEEYPPDRSYEQIKSNIFAYQNWVVPEYHRHQRLPVLAAHRRG